MRSFNNILSDIHAGKEVDNQELKMALLLAENQLTLSEKKLIDTLKNEIEIKEICINK